MGSCRRNWDAPPQSGVSTTKQTRQPPESHPETGRYSAGEGGPDPFRSPATLSIGKIIQAGAHDQTSAWTGIPEGRWGEPDRTRDFWRTATYTTIRLCLRCSRPGERLTGTDSHRGPGQCDTLTQVSGKKQWGVGADGRPAWLT